MTKEEERNVVTGALGASKERIFMKFGN